MGSAAWDFPSISLNREALQKAALAGSAGSQTFCIKFGSVRTQISPVDLKLMYNTAYVHTAYFGRA